MKICISGSQMTGKSTLIKDFLKEFPMYTVNEIDYRDLITDKGLKLNKDGTQESQEIILNSLSDAAMYAPAKGDIIFDRCTLDNLAYTLWLKDKHPALISDNFLRKCIDIHKQAAKFYDIIFYTPITKYDTIPIEDKENRETDLEYREEIDNIFAAIAESHAKSTGGFFDANDAPALIEVFGSPEERIQMIKFYLDPKTGQQYGEDDNLIAKVMS